MKNPVICKNCSAENPLYSHICSNCKHFLRDKISNIDIWETISGIIESPSNAFQKIILSEHKNFIVFITLILAVRILILSRFVSVPFSKSAIPELPIFLIYLIVLFAFAILLIIISLLTSFILNKIDFRTRFRDIYTLNVFSQMPNLFSVITLFPIELIVFGNYLFSNNPYPFQVKGTISFLLIGFEIGIIGWSLVLNYLAMYTVTRNKTAGLIISLISSIIILLLIIILATVLFI
jgi:hypothetical protein